MFNCFAFAKELVKKNKPVDSTLLAPRIRAWRNRPYPPLLNEWRIAKIRYHLQYTLKQDPNVYGLPPSKPESPPILKPIFNKIQWARKAARREFVKQQVERMDQIIAEWRIKKKAAYANQGK